MENFTPWKSVPFLLDNIRANIFPYKCFFLLIYIGCLSRLIVRCIFNQRFDLPVQLLVNYRILKDYNFFEIFFSFFFNKTGLAHHLGLTNGSEHPWCMPFNRNYPSCLPLGNVQCGPFPALHQNQHFSNLLNLTNADQLPASNAGKIKFFISAML